MPFVKGMPRPANAGRKKGSLNRVNPSAAERLAELGCDPLQGMALIAANKKNPVEVRGRMYAELAKYRYPQLKAIEHTGNVSGQVQVDIRAALMQVVAKLPEDARALVAREMMELEKAG